MLVKGQKKLDRRGLIRVCRRFGVAPIFMDQLKNGAVVDLPEDKASALIARNYAYAVDTSVDIGDIKMEDHEIETEETVQVIETEEGETPFVDESSAVDEITSSDAAEGEEDYDDEVEPESKDVTL